MCLGSYLNIDLLLHVNSLMVVNVKLMKSARFKGSMINTCIIINRFCMIWYSIHYRCTYFILWIADRKSFIMRKHRLSEGQERTDHIQLLYRISSKTDRNLIVFFLEDTRSSGCPLWNMLGMFLLRINLGQILSNKTDLTSNVCPSMYRLSTELSLFALS